MQEKLKSTFVNIYEYTSPEPCGASRGEAEKKIYLKNESSHSENPHLKTE